MENKSSNKSLRNANKAKNDEFYTQLTDIEKEVIHYKDQLKGRVILCNCDDPEWSDFFRYFVFNFDYLGIKKIISTHYEPVKTSYKIEITPKNYQKIQKNLFGKMGFPDNLRKPLKENGDFRSKECIALLKQSDVVITNPPFSLFREYVAQLMEYNKKFLIIANQNAITYKEIFKLIKENKLWLGYDNGGTKWFQVPDHYDITTESRKKVENGKKYFSMGSIVWFTNLDTTKRHEKITLYKNYNLSEYPKYDNFDAIEVSKVSEIPKDYDGAMGVPITFLDKYNPGQFEILDAIGRYSILTGPTEKTKGYYLTKIGGKPKYARVIIKNKKI